MRISGWLYLLEQTGVSICLLAAVGMSAGVRLHLPRLMLTGLLIALTGLTTAGTPLLLRLTLMVITAMPAVLLACPGIPRRLLLRTASAVLLLSITAAGFLRLMLPLPSALAVLLCCAGLRSIPVVVPRQEELPRLATADIRCGAHHVALTALVDSGNLLRDALTGLPVIVISRSSAARLIPLSPGNSLTPGMRLIPVRTISGTTMMTVFRPDQICILSGGAWQRAEALVGISPDGYEGFQALLPASLLPHPLHAPLSSISEGG